MSIELMDTILFENIADIVYDYSEKCLFADKLFIDEICNIIKDLLDLDEYLDEIIVDFKSKTSHYNPVEHDITINPTLNHNKIFMKRLSKKDYCYWYNLFVVQTIYHELEHARQEKLKYNDEKSIEKDLVVLNDPKVYLLPFEEYKKLSFIKQKINDMRLNKYYRYYRRHHDLAPIERMANIKANVITQNVSKKLDKIDGIEKFRMCSMIELYRQAKHGYKLVGNLTNSPSIDYLSHMKYTNNIEIINKTKAFRENNLSYFEKVIYGLYLSKDEYDSLEDFNILK